MLFTFPGDEYARYHASTVPEPGAPVAGALALLALALLLQSRRARPRASL